MTAMTAVIALSGRYALVRVGTAGSSAKDELVWPSNARVA